MAATLPAVAAAPTDEPTAAPTDPLTAAPTSTPAPLPSDTPTPTATPPPANLPVAEIVAPADGAELPAGQPVAIIIAASDAAGLAGLTVEVNGRRLAEYTLDGETLYTRTVEWAAPETPGAAVFTVWAVNVNDVPTAPQSIAVTLVAATEEPTAIATARAAAANTTTPVSTLLPTPAATVLPAAPSPPAPAGPQTVANFEAFGAWRGGDQANGTFSQTSEQSRGGFAARFEYNFPGPDNDFMVFSQLHDIAGRPNALKVWVYGDNSGHYLNACIIDAEGQAWAAPFGRVQHSGWQQLTARIDTDPGWPWGHVYGPDNGQVDYPIQFSSFVLDDAANDDVGTGAIYLDDLTALTE